MQLETTHDSSKTPDLGDILRAWQDATVRLEQTHEALRSEVRRLTAELEAKNRELARKNRLADLGQMAAHIAHEVRNTLVPVSLYLSLLRRKLAPDRSSREVLDKIGAGFTALEATVGDLLNFTADREPHAELVSVAESVRYAFDALAPQLAAQNVRIIDELNDEHEFPIDREMLRRAVMNIVLNALDVMPAGGELFATSICTDEGWEIEISDSGTGWTDDALQRASEPFFTTKSHGTGLGLAIVERIMDAHGGHMNLRNCSTGGASITLSFPHVAITESAGDGPIIAKFPSAHDNTFDAGNRRHAA